MSNDFLKTPALPQHRFIAGLGIGQIVSWGTFYYSFPLIAPPMAEEFGLDKPAVYAAATVGLTAASLAAYPVGVAIDRGHGRTIMTLGSFLGGLLLLLWARIHEPLSLYVLFAGIGLVQAMTLYEPAFALIARRDGRLARNGITALTLWGGFASAVFTPLIQILLNYGTWRDTLTILGSINLFLCVLLHFLVINPASDIPGPALPAGSPPPRTGTTAVAWALRQPAFWGLLVTFTVSYAVLSGLLFHLYPMLLEQGFDTVTTVTAIAVIGPAQVLGRIAIWLFAGRRPIRIIGAVTIMVFPLALLLLLFAPRGVMTVMGFAVLYGGANGIMTIVRGLAVPEMISREAYGAINGALAIPATIAKALAPLAAALLWASAGTYDSVLLAALAGSGIAVSGFWFAVFWSRPKP